MKTTVYKLTIMALDFEGCGPDVIRACVESARGVDVNVLDCDSREVEWSDDHPLSKHSTFAATFEQLFSDSPK